jgi:hypothetical protein
VIVANVRTVRSQYTVSKNDGTFRTGGALDGYKVKLQLFGVAEMTWAMILRRRPLTALTSSKSRDVEKKQCSENVDLSTFKVRV